MTLTKNNTSTCRRTKGKWTVFRRDLKAPLWLTNSRIRQQLEEQNSWWLLVGIYRDHLNSIGHYIEPHRLSRKLDQYVEKYRAKRVGDEENQRGFTLPPLDAPNWANEFKASNVEWMEKRSALTSRAYCTSS